ncbi:CocE/NonD family hydrolase [Microbacterium sp.]|uniref:CocE/NonD family hydrolase n=1 Tax=Microbacterium sp. TaxID=51671 RepID=UPI00333E3BFA
MTSRIRLNRAARGEYRQLSGAPDAPPATHRRGRVTRGIRVSAADGAALLTDHWRAEGAGGTTLLVRTPYGRANMEGVARFFAERGHHVVVQSCRGTFGSEGAFDPLHDEASDGQATLAWLRAQPWATGPVLSWGGSYVGLTQWALCEGPLLPDAMGIAVSARRFDEAILYRGGGFSMDTVLAWAVALDLQERTPLSRLWAMLRSPRRLRRASFAVPPTDAPHTARAGSPRWVTDWIEHSDAGDPWWQPLHFADDPARIPPTVLMAGWQDFFLEGQLDDHRFLVDSGVPVRLVVGDWGHGGPDVLRRGAIEALRGFDDPTAGPAVSVEVSGGAGWRELEAWPPPSAPQTWEATAGGGLVERRDDASSTTAAAALTYRYDPADPTPAAGGRSLNPFTAGRRDQRRRERRDDVLVFTGPRLDEDLLAMGTAEVELTVSSSLPRADVFVRLCEVDEKGASTGLTDGYLRLGPDTAPDGTGRVRISLAPLAHRFAAGHRLRLQVSSGAHPVQLRNPGTDDPVRDFRRLRASVQTVSLGGEAPLLLRLPVVD